jgi:hypothetical protein
LNPVKQQLGLTVVVSIVTAALCAFIWHHDPDQAATDDRLGNVIVTSLAHSSILPLTTADQNHLGVLANRAYELPEVAGVAIYTIDNKLLALSGSLDNGLPFTQTVDVNDTIIGYVRISLVPSVPSANAFWVRVGLSVGAVFLVALAVLIAFTPRRKVPTLTVEIPQTPAVPPVPQVHYLAVANLYNSLSLSPDERTRVLNADLEIIQRVANLYAGQASVERGKGLLLHFEEIDATDRCLDAVSAALLSASLISEEASAGVYRFGLHRLVLDPGEGLSGRSREIEDTWLLAALARQGTLAVSERFAAGLSGHRPVEISPLHHPMLKDLDTMAGSAFIITGVGDDQQQILDEQQALLMGYDPSTLRRSTF